MKVSPLVAAVSLLFVVGVESSATNFFSTDLGTDELVLIDSATGAVTTVGPLGFDADDVDLITIGSQLFGLESDFTSRVDLHQLNPVTGASIWSAQVHTNAANVINAEGLAQVNGQLKIGFLLEPAPFQARSNALGDLGFDGLITGIETGAGDIDFDGLGVRDAGGLLYGTDGNLFGAPNTTRYFTVSEAPLIINEFYTNTINPLPNVDDIVVRGNTLFAVGDENGDQFHTLDLTTHAFSSFTLDRPGHNFSGLALAEPIDYGLTVEYRTPEVTGPLIDGFDPIPETITARFTLQGVQPGQTTIGLDQVLSFDLEIPGDNPTRDDLDSFQLGLNANGSPTELNWGGNVGFKIILNNNFTLEITGTDPETEQEFRYFWSESTDTFSPAPGLTGDYNNDGTVDAADYVVWRKNAGTTNPLPNDPLGGRIGQAQYANWRANFDSPMPASGAVTAVPEPAAGLLLVALAILPALQRAVLRRRRRAPGVDVLGPAARTRQKKSSAICN